MGNEELKYAFFTGCTVPAREPCYEISARKVLDALGVEVVDVKGFSCCAPNPLYSLNYLTGLSISARNLSLAEELGLDILTLCNGCFETLSIANEILKKNYELRDRVNSILSEVGREFRGRIEVKHIVEVLYDDVGLERIRRAVVKPFNGLVVGTFYGCHLVRPSEAVNFDDPERPLSLDELVESVGMKSVSYPNKMECCGGPLRIVREDVSIGLVRRKLLGLKESGAECVVTACPFCFVQFDRGQIEIGDKYGERYDIPPLHVTECLGLAMGFTPEELGLDVHAIPADAVLKRGG